MTRREVEALARMVAAQLKPVRDLAVQTALIAAQTDLANKANGGHLHSLQGDVAELMDAPRLVYRGTYSPTDTYYLGNFVTHRGSVWHCNAKDVSGTDPGEELTDGTRTRAWTLAVKRGSRGKPALTLEQP